MCHLHDILLILGALGLLFILKEGTIFDVPRNILKAKSPFFKELLECPQCLGFWTGFGSKLYFILLIHKDALSLETISISVFFGFVVSLLGIIVHDFLDILDSKAYILNHESIEKDKK